MFEFIRIFFTGMFISFLGALPLGTLNVTAMQISIYENYRNAIKFALGASIVEIAYVRLSLTGIDWVMRNQTLFYILEWATVGLFIILAISSFIAAGKPRGNDKNIVLQNKASRFLLGLGMSAFNPVQIPFWFIWSTYLLSNKVLLPTEWYFNIYIIGIGIGTLLGMAIFIYAGKWIVNRLQASHKIINIVVGAVFVISAAIQLYRVIYSPLNERLKQKAAIQITPSSKA